MPERMIGREDPVVTMPMLAWGRDQVGEAVEQFVGGEVDEALSVGCG